MRDIDKFLFIVLRHCERHTGASAHEAAIAVDQIGVAGTNQDAGIANKPQSAKTIWLLEGSAGRRRTAKDVFVEMQTGEPVVPRGFDKSPDRRRP